MTRRRRRARRNRAFARMENEVLQLQVQRAMCEHAEAVVRRWQVGDWPGVAWRSLCCARCGAILGAPEIDG